MENLKILYQKFITHLTDNKTRFKERELAMFTAVAGKNYWNLPPDKRVMIIGRALNGGKEDNNLYIDKSETHILCLNSLHKGIELDNLDWVKNQWGVKSDYNTKKYNTKKSAFWRVANSVTSILNQRNDKDISTDDIVWSNLYKAAMKKGNPSQRLKKLQLSICKEILDAEIDYFKPSVLVFLTGSNWARQFLEGAEIKQQDETYKHVKESGKYKDLIYVVGQHPQGKGETLHTKEIITQLIVLRSLRPS